MDHPRVKGLDSVRGIAALIVLMCHLFRITFLEANPHTLESEINYTFLQYLVNGRLAVIIFFVLSGFVLCYTVFPKNEPFSYKTYSVKRIARIYIPYIVVMAVSWELYKHATLVNHSIPVSWDDWRAPKTVQALTGMLFMGGFVGDNVLDGVTWTLFIEMQISLVFPSLVFLIKKYGVWALAGCLAVSMIASKLYVMVDGNSLMQLARTLPGRVFLTIYYMQFFAVGIFIFLNSAMIQTWVKKVPLAVHIGIVAVLLLTPFKLYRDHFLLADMVYLVIAALVIIYCISFEKVARALSAGFLQWLGSISYSLYLVHPPILFTAAFLLYHHLPMDVIVLIAFPVIFIAADLSHRFIEIPSIALGKKLTAGWRSARMPSR